MKAQIFTADAITASAIIIMAIGIVLFIHDSMLEEINYSYSSSLIDRTAQSLLSQVINNVSENAVVDDNKATSLFSKTYSELSQQFGVSYNF